MTRQSLMHHSEHTGGLIAYGPLVPLVNRNHTVLSLIPQ